MLHVEIITPDQIAYRGDADSVSVPTSGGEITILPHHIPLISTTVPGTAVVRIGRDEHVFAITRGLIEVNGTSVRVLTDSADRADDLEEAAVQEARAKAQALQKERSQDSEGFAEATAILERELAKLRTVRRRRHSRSPNPLDTQS